MAKHKKSEHDKHEARARQVIDKKLQKSLNAWRASTIILAVILAVAVILLGVGVLHIGAVTWPGVGRGVSPDIVKGRVLKTARAFIPPQFQISITNVTDIGSLYLLSVEASSGLRKERVVWYATKDGALFFPGAINLSNPNPSQQNNQNNQEQGFKPEKTEKPNVKLFVMSFCPFGNQAENNLAPVYKLLKDKVEWEPHYIVSKTSDGNYRSLHGNQELNQDVRELCVLEHEGIDKWWDFVLKINEKCNYRNADTCWEPIAQELGLNTTMIKQCQEQEASQLLDREIEVTSKYRVSASPTLLVNDKPYSGSRTPEAYKSAICKGFTTQPGECSEKLENSGTGSQGNC